MECENEIKCKFIMKCSAARKELSDYMKREYNPPSRITRLHMIFDEFLEFKMDVNEVA